ncbi:MAG: MFS transporter [Betaproteobacteria bacterium]|nr:MFS transporter [Betaproteobacteria bacterium]MDH5341392.1 MFS transporter [Betaproteobacteria bacterium]
MAPILRIVLLSILTHTAYKGSKVLMSLSALELGANEFFVGMLFSTYALFPLLLSVYAGKISDRVGFRAPMLFGTVGLFIGLALPFLFFRLEALYIAAALIGFCYIFYTVAIQHLIGAMAEGTDRTRNYSWFSLGIGMTALLGPTSAGFLIDAVGHRATFVVLAAMPVLPVLLLSLWAGFLPGTSHAPVSKADKAGHRVGDLVRNRPLRRALITAGIIETGLELYNLLLPIYGHRIGLSASEIGLILGAFGLALLVVRALMPHLIKRSSEERVLAASLLLATGVCVVFPFVTSFVALLAISFVLGMGLGCGSPLSMMLAYNRAPAGRSGEAMGLRQMVNKGTEILVPFVFGSLSTAFGMVPVFWLDAVLLAVAAGMMRKDAAAIRKPPE